MYRILVVDDEEGIREALLRFLTRSGHEVLTASNGKAALDQLHRGSMDLIITDVFMPDMDGVEFALKLRKAASATPFIAMSGGGAYGNVDILKLIGQMGAAKTIEKPFDLEDLLSLVNEVMAGSPSR